MFKIEQHYKDFLGNDQVETLRFNISESEMYDLAKNNPKFNVDYLRTVMEKGNGMEIIDVVRELIVLSYGELSEDGKKFRKSNEIALEFCQSAAYDALFDRLVSSNDEKFILEFLTGVFPDKFADTIKNNVPKG